MKTILYMAITVNGIIAKNDDSAEFLTAAEADSYMKTVCTARALIVGRRTYEVLSEQPEFKTFTDQGVSIVVVTKNSAMRLKSTTHKTAASPHNALKLLSGYETVIIAGGGTVNTAFMEAGLIDELYIDIEPTIIGEGIPLFRKGNFDYNLKLLGQKMLSSNEVQLHYKVIK